MMNRCNCCHTSGVNNNVYAVTIVMAAYFKNEYAAIIISVLYRMFTKQSDFIYAKKLYRTPRFINNGSCTEPIRI